jgi:hypothetical protein
MHILRLLEKKKRYGYYESRPEAVINLNYNFEIMNLS